MARRQGEQQVVPTDYPERIRRLREQHGLTQARLAALLGVSFASVNRWENGQSRPHRLAWQQIARAEALGIGTLAAARGSLPATVSPVEPGEEPPQIDFGASPEAVRAVVEGERLSYGHLFNPAFAAEISLIEPLPHQRLAVYERMLPQARLRFLLADDAGAGKTIMAGLYVRELLSRRLVRRVLVVAPAGLLGNWERELRTLFSLACRVVRGADSAAGNPFLGEGSDLIIVSMDTLAAERTFSRLREPGVIPYDLAIIDEAHKLSADREPDFRVRKTERYRLAESLAGIPADEERWLLEWSCHHLLLLTATPHMGRDYPYFALWRLLEPDVLSTPDAFHAYPPDARRRHFVRRTKEEMVRLDGSRIYPTRVTDTLSYDLTLGEQQLYDETTDYIRTYYNQAAVLNRSAARLAMSVFQRRLTSSTAALARSFERRLEKLERLIREFREGRLDSGQLALLQIHLERRVRDLLDEETADEEEAEGGREQSERAQDDALDGVVAQSLAELELERGRVVELLALARRLEERGEESKLEKLLEIVRDPEHRDDKLLIFTEHRDTLNYLVRRLEGLGFTGRVASIHGGLDYRDRDAQVELFRRPAPEGGATYLVATDAAGEGINLQFCGRMVNYDVPWNPARLEQRMGRIHRYGQKRDPVLIANLLAGKTREGRVLKTLLEKLEKIRRELRSDKVFDVVGRLFEGVSIKEYMALALTEEGADEAAGRLEGQLTPNQVQALEARERALYGGGEVESELPRLREDLEREAYRRLLPGYVRRYLEAAAPLLGIAIDGDPGGLFSFRPERPGALDPLWPALEAYPPERRARLTVSRPDDPGSALFLHPGEPFFERFRGYFRGRFEREALRGAVFRDPSASEPYLLHLAVATVERRADPELPALGRAEIVEQRLVALRQTATGHIESCPVERLMLLQGAGTGAALRGAAARLASQAAEARTAAEDYLRAEVLRPLAEARRRTLCETLAEREAFLRRGFDYREAELAAARAQLSRKGDAPSAQELGRIRERQRRLHRQREEALAVLRREPELLAPGETHFLAHALVVPTDDPTDRSVYDAAIEEEAVRVAWAGEEAAGAVVRDVSTPERSRAAGLGDHPGFDLLSRRPDGEERPIEVKGRAGVGDVELTDNEWARACNLRERYWLYVVFDCGTPRPRLFRVRDPFGRLLSRPKGGVIIAADLVMAQGTND